MHKYLLLAERSRKLENDGASQMESMTFLNKALYKYFTKKRQMCFQWHQIIFVQVTMTLTVKHFMQLIRFYFTFYEQKCFNKCCLFSTNRRKIFFSCFFLFSLPNQWILRLMEPFYELSLKYWSFPFVAST